MRGGAGFEKNGQMFDILDDCRRQPNPHVQARSITSLEVGRGPSRTARPEYRFMMLKRS